MMLESAPLCASTESSIERMSTATATRVLDPDSRALRTARAIHVSSLRSPEPAASALVTTLPSNTNQISTAELAGCAQRLSASRTSGVSSAVAIWVSSTWFAGSITFIVPIRNGLGSARLTVDVTHWIRTATASVTSFIAMKLIVPSQRRNQYPAASVGSLRGVAR